MTSLLEFLHEWIGYAVFLALIASALVAFSRAKDAREFRPGPFLGVVVALDIQVLLGLVQYAAGQHWLSPPQIAYLHPLLAAGALGIAHAALKRARSETMAADAHRKVGRGLVVSILFVLAAIGVASAPTFL